MQLVNTNHKLTNQDQTFFARKTLQFSFQDAQLLDSSQFSKLNTALMVENVLEKRKQHPFLLSSVNHQ
jgi:hypothetical protein